jgi:hypothetical protein
VEEISPRKFARRESSDARRLNFWEKIGELLDEIFSVSKPKMSFGEGFSWPSEAALRSLLFLMFWLLVFIASYIICLIRKVAW